MPQASCGWSAKKGPHKMVNSSALKNAAIVSAGAMLLTAAGWAAINAAPVQQASAETGGTSVTAAAAARISSVYTKKQTSDDKLPSFLTAGPQRIDGLQYETARLLGIDGTTKVWTALGADAKTCVITLLAGPDEFASSTCTTPADFELHGLGLQSSGTGSASRVYFVPAGLSAAGTGLRAIGPQLLAGDANETDAKPITLQSVSAATSGNALARSAPTSVVTLPPFTDIREAMVD